MARVTRVDLQKQADEILKIAEEVGVQTNFFFFTTFKRYQVQLSILSELEVSIKENGMLVRKEYVKGRGNIYTNPAVTEYNKTADAANRTVQTLMRIINGFGKSDAERDGGDVDPLLAAIEGAGDDDEDSED